MRILVVEDDQDLAETIRHILHYSYTVDLAPTVQAGQNYLRMYPYCALVFDWSLPDGEGVELCRRARQDGISTPILMLTAKDTPQAKVQGLEAGADDYLTKPFHKEELKARLRALTRRASRLTQTEQPHSSILTAGPIRMNLSSMELFWNKTPIELSRKEWLILELLIRNKPQVVNKETILSQVWEFNHWIGSNSIEVHVRNLRAKLDRRFGRTMIHTVRGSGYRITASSTS